MSIETGKKYKELSKGSSTTFTASPGEFDTSGPSFSATGKAYTVLLVNETNHCFENVRLRVGSNPWPNWWPCPTVCNNCAPGNYQNCQQTPETLTAIMQIDCGGAPFDVQIATKFDANGKALGVTFSGLSADCQFAGGFLTVTA
jgi:hypothetical protein